MLIFPLKNRKVHGDENEIIVVIFCPFSVFTIFLHFLSPLSLFLINNKSFWVYEPEYRIEKLKEVCIKWGYGWDVYFFAHFHYLLLAHILLTKELIKLHDAVLLTACKLVTIRILSMHARILTLYLCVCSLDDVLRW